MSSQPPDAAAEIHAVAESLEEQADQIDEFQQELSEARQRVNDLDDSKQWAFYEKAKGIRDDLGNIESVEALLEIQDDIEEAINSPLQEAALDALEAFLSEVEPELSARKEDDVREQIADSIPDDLEEIAETYQELTDHVRDLPSTPTKIIADLIEKRASLLTTPSMELADTIGALERRHEALKKIDTTFTEGGSWTANIEFAGTVRFYKQLDRELDPDGVDRTIENIDSHVSALSEAELSLTEAVKKDLEERIRNAEADTLAPEFNAIDDSLKSLVNKHETVRDWVTALDEFGTDRGIYEGEIDDYLARYEQLKIQSYSSLSAMLDEMGRLAEDIAAFLDSLTRRVNAQRGMAADLQAELDHLEMPEVPLATDPEESVMTSAVHADPGSALEASATYDSWITEAFEEFEGSFDTDEAVTIWRALYDEEQVPITAENQETILALADRFTLEVVLGSE